MSDIMRPRFAALISAVLALLPMAASHPAFSAEKLSGGDIGCTSPIRSDETGLTMLKRFGKQARVAAITDVEGESVPGLMLSPDDPKLQLEVNLQNEIRDKVTELTLKAKDSQWSVFGLKIGMTLEEVTAASGAPLKLTGFWQHVGGTYDVFGDFKPGKLSGGCRLIVMFRAPDTAKVPEPLYGLEEIASDDPRLLKLKPTVSELSIVWDQPEDGSSDQ